MTPEELAGYEFAAGSIGPKVEAATRFVAQNRPAGGDRLARRHRRIVTGNAAADNGSRARGGMTSRAEVPAPGKSVIAMVGQTSTQWYLWRRQATFIGVGAMVGAGIYALLGAAA